MYPGVAATLDPGDELLSATLPGFPARRISPRQLHDVLMIPRVWRAQTNMGDVDHRYPLLAASVGVELAEVERLAARPAPDQAGAVSPDQELGAAVRAGDGVTVGTALHAGSLSQTTEIP